MSAQSSSTMTIIHTQSRFSIAFTAFWSIFLRDMLVTGRELISFLIQVVLQPLFYLFIFGKVLPAMGTINSAFAALLLPGVVALTAFLTAFQGVTLPLVIDLGYSREIEDRLLAPLPVSIVAIEKIVVGVIRGVLAGALIFPLAWWILGDAYLVRTDLIGLLIALMVLVACTGATFGLFFGTIVQPDQISLLFSLVLTPLIFTGCIYYPWGTLTLKWFQIAALFNPLTYAAEGLRYAMVPTFNGHVLQTMDLKWILIALSAATILFFVLGLHTFYRRVIS